MEIHFGVRSEIGPVRKENQDHYLVTDISKRYEPPPGKENSFEPGDAGAVLAVADGMGGHRGGRQASELALTSLLARIVEGAGDQASDRMRAGVEAADENVIAKAKQDKSLEGMGTIPCRSCLVCVRLMGADR